MRQKVISLLLSFLMVLSLMPAPVFAASGARQTQAIPSNYFYRQLNSRAQAIYDKLLTEFAGSNASAYYSGTKIIDLMGLQKGGQTVIDEQDVKDYVEKGNKDIFNDFCAAKDALDLDHSELWYLDSGYLTFQVTKEETGGYHVLIGPGRGETYLLAGKTIEGLQAKIAETNEAVQTIVDEAISTVEAAERKASTQFSEQDRKAALITAVHDQVVKKIHYRYETECRDIGDTKHANARYIRTLYGIVSHEGVCEAYARTMQVCLTRLGIECVLVHGVQCKGTPEDHMWNAVNIPDSQGDHWYVVDATWDDPLTADYDGKRDLTFKNGEDGKETNTYLMVGQSLVGEYWRPSGYVSTGNFEFTYPTIETAAYAGTVAYGDDNGLKVKYSAGGSMEDAPAGVYTATYKGMNAKEAAKEGFYFMLKQYDYHADGTAHVMNEWYYADAALIATGGTNAYFGDYPDGLRFSSATCEYTEIAVTTRKPKGYDQWGNNPENNPLSQDPDVGFFHGDDREIVASSGMLYNVNSQYEAPPYVLTQTPAPNGSATAGYDYRFQVTYDDDLYHILPYETSASAISSADPFANDYPQAKSQTVQVRYATSQQDLHNPGKVMTTQVSGELPFDTDRDGIVDMGGSYTDFTWIYKSDPQEKGGQGVTCPNQAYHKSGQHACSVEAGCPIVGVAFNFRASDQWIDDVTQYEFSIEGVVGSRSSKYANNFAVIAMVPGLCPTSLRSQGIDWNLWGMPTLLDAPDNLDLYGMAQAGGTNQDVLDALNEQMNVNDVDGRLMLVVEDQSKGAGNREEFEKIDDYLNEKGQIDGTVIDSLDSLVYEINFNRLCPQVDLKPNKGQSLRVQIGYPAGVTYESLGSGDIVLKAYHFTRCDENHHCEEYNKESPAAQKVHKWGSHIMDVDEIQIIPTPYGLVLLCDAFSPFEIVAVKPNTPIRADAAEKTLVVVSGGNGTVKYQKGEEEVEAVGAHGNITLAPGASQTFTVKPAEGYTVSTVSLDGKEISVEGNQFTVHASDMKQSAGVLSVTFVPSEVETQQKQENYGTAVVATVCTHTHTEKVPESRAEAEATCEQDGYAWATKCTDCGQILTPAHVIPATGHTIDQSTYREGTPATCTEPGTRAYAKCKVCGATISDGGTLPALGHLFPADTYAKDEKHEPCQSYTKAVTCERCNQTVTIHLTGHPEHMVEKVDAKEPTSTQDGNIAYWHCRECGGYFRDAALTEAIRREDTILPATGSSSTPGTPGTTPGTPGGIPGTTPGGTPGTTPGTPGGTNPPAASQPSVTADSEQVTWKLSEDGTEMEISVKDGFEIYDVLVNGESKGAVAKLTGLKPGDKVVVKTRLILSETDRARVEHLRTCVEKTTIDLKSKATKKGIRIDWEKSPGYKVDYYEVFKSLKRFSGFGKAAYYRTKTGTKTYYVNTKELQEGTRYYYKVRGVRSFQDGTTAYTQWSAKAWRKSPVTKG